MIKFVMAAAWIAAVAIGSVYYSFNAAQNRPVEQPPSFFGGLDYVRTDVVSVPIFREGRVLGYFFGRLVYTAETKQLKTLAIPAEALVTDQVYSYLYANPQIDFLEQGGVDIDAIRSGIRDAVNERLGMKLIHEVLIEQLDFLTKEDIRDNSRRGNVSADRAQPDPEAVIPASAGRSAH